MRKVIQLVDLRAETSDDVHADRTVQVAEGKVSSVYTINSEVERDSEFRLAWLWVEGWRAKIRKSGDVVEKARWEWRVDDLLAASRIKGASARIPDIVVGHPSVLKKVGTNNSNSTTRRQDSGSRKSVRWPDQGER